jgi:site-specific DNA recombinase
MPSLRCAIYTRKSTEDGLEQDFNSLDAQREACEAFINSQKSEGWRLIKGRYDDGGLSGGSMERPALKKLLSDVRAGKVDIIVVYKVDRLTRSLTDFAKIVEILDNKEASFVSVTQAFNTTTSMGRLTLNVLLSFAQFEREVTAERIRDKIAASRKKGLWMGGPVPLGYDVKDKKLLINGPEAKMVQSLYKLYLDLDTVRDVKIEAGRRGYRTKRQTYSTGRQVGGCEFTRGRLYHLLRNPLYIGRVKHKDQTYLGRHKEVIDQQTWEEVQAKLEGRAMRSKDMPRCSNKPLLLGLLFDEAGERLTTNHSLKNGKRYRYYVSKPPDDKKSKPEDNGWRLPAAELERLVVNELMSVLTDPIKVMDMLKSKQRPDLREELSQERLERILPDLVDRIELSRGHITFQLNTLQMAKLTSLKNTSGQPAYRHCTPVLMKRRGVETKIVIPGDNRPPKTKDPKLASLIGRSHVWFEQLKGGERSSIAEIARVENIDPGDVSRFLPLAFLAPDIVRAILKGEHDPEITTESLKRLSTLPIVWQDQRTRLGF